MRVDLHPEACAELRSAALWYEERRNRLGGRVVVKEFRFHRMRLEELRARVGGTLHPGKDLPPAESAERCSTTVEPSCGDRAPKSRADDAGCTDYPCAGNLFKSSQRSAQSCGGGARRGGSPTNPSVSGIHCQSDGFREMRRRWRCIPESF